MSVNQEGVCIVGGAGHVGAPLAIVLASRGLDVTIHDINVETMATLARGELPFLEEGAEPLLRAALGAGRLAFSADPASVAHARYVILTIGTPIDEFHQPMLRLVEECVDVLLPHLKDEQTLILRSTVYPGVTEHLHRRLRAGGKKTLLAYCPERVVQGQSVRELTTLPQIVSGATPEAASSASRLFERIAPKIVPMSPKEAEYAKLISNAYRYIQFATTNQFYMMVEAEGLDYDRLLAGLKDGYPRLAGMPRAGFAAGPCLFKDTLQLAAASRTGAFSLGLAAVQVNEGLPAFVVSRLAEEHRLAEMSVGILGMACKADSDDTRASLSYRLLKLLEPRAREVLISDPWVKTDPNLRPIGEVLSLCDVFVVGVPHTAYRTLKIDKPVVDVWNVIPRG